MSDYEQSDYVGNSSEVGDDFTVTLQKFKDEDSGQEIFKFSA